MQLSIKWKIWDEPGTSTPDSLPLIETPWGNLDGAGPPRTYIQFPCSCKVMGRIEILSRRIYVTSSIMHNISRNPSELRTCIQRLCHQSSFARKHTGLSVKLQICMKGNILRITCNSAPNSLLQIETPWALAWHKMDQEDRGESHIHT